MQKTYRCNTLLTRYDGPSAWYFLAIPKKESADIKKSQEQRPRKGWGSIPVSVTIGKTRWETSIFPEKGGVYLLPVKASVRHALGLADGDRVNYRITIT